ncbi:MAG: YceD family protein [Sulfurisoma sp.]|nr:YceD family protein [Sulfurisoma sp.]
MSRQKNSPTDVSAAVIDSMEFSRQGRVISGEVAVAALGRLADVVVEPVGTLHCTLRGLPGMDRLDGKPGLALEVSGSLKFRCQRCLQAMDFPLRVASHLLLLAPGETLPDDVVEDDDEVAGDELDDEWDAIEASREQSVLALIEDEVLLALPIVPRHDACEPPVVLGDEHEPSPFAVLAKLKLQ